MDPGYPARISNWGWPAGFGSVRDRRRLFSRSKCYFFDGNRYIRVTRGNTGPGRWILGIRRDLELGLARRFRRSGIDAALYSRSKCYFFNGNRYIRVTRGDIGPGSVDPGLSGADLELGLARRFRRIRYR